MIRLMGPVFLRGAQRLRRPCESRGTRSRRSRRRDLHTRLLGYEPSEQLLLYSAIGGDKGCEDTCAFRHRLTVGVVLACIRLGAARGSRTRNVLLTREASPLGEDGKRSDKGSGDDCSSTELRPHRWSGRRGLNSRHVVPTTFTASSAPTSLAEMNERLRVRLGVRTRSTVRSSSM